MKKKSIIIFMFAMMSWIPLIHAEPAPETLRQTIRDYIENQQKLHGAFAVVDERLPAPARPAGGGQAGAGESRILELVRVHERVGKTGDYYYSCTDMLDVKTGDLLDLDFDIEDREGELAVVDVRFHKDNGIPRYTYDEFDQRVPVLTTELQPTQEGSSLSGKAAFIESGEGLKISVFIAGSPPGKHGFHIHEKGDCSDSGNAAGGHFNPEGAAHGDILKDGFQHAHAGDLGNIEIGLDGKGTLEKVVPGLTLKEGQYAVAGRALILHEKEDDFGQPTGNAGGRIACGVIP